LIRLTERTPLHLPGLHLFETGGIIYGVDAEAPNWIAVEPRASMLFDASVVRQTYAGRAAVRPAERPARALAADQQRLQSISRSCRRSPGTPARARSI